MKAYKIKAAILALVCVLTLPVAGCTKKGTESLTSEELADVQHKELEIVVVGTEEVKLTETVPAGTTATTDPATTTTVSTVTDSAGNKYVAVTDVEGTTVTDGEGLVVTEPYVETTTVTTTTTAAEPIIALMETRHAIWWDISKQADYNFNGSFMVLTFKIKDGAKAGNYPINITSTDFSNYNAETLDVVSQNGYVTIGDVAAPEQVTPSGDDFTVYVQNASGNTGDTIDVVLNVANNPGLVAFVLRFQYDSNVLEYVKGGFGDDFASVN